MLDEHQAKLRISNTKLTTDISEPIECTLNMTFFFRSWLTEEVRMNWLEESAVVLLETERLF
jgi:hypothetical protein